MKFNHDTIDYCFYECQNIVEAAYTKD